MVFFLFLQHPNIQDVNYLPLHIAQQFRRPQKKKHKKNKKNFLTAHILSSF